jgi:putative ABC transport system permease protein
MSYLVSQRIPEFGLRIALGASRAAVLRLVGEQSAKLVAIGAGVGIVGAELSSRAIASLLYGVAPFDLVTLTCVSALFLTVALLASYVPARRAAKIDPMAALRYE